MRKCLCMCVRVCERVKRWQSREVLAAYGSIFVLQYCCGEGGGVCRGKRNSIVCGNLHVACGMLYAQSWLPATAAASVAKCTRTLGYSQGALLHRAGAIGSLLLVSLCFCDCFVIISIAAG